MTSVSIVIPIHNEVESLPELHRQISAMAEENELRVQVVMVDDGSTDGSWREIERAAQADPRVVGVRLRRNFAKAAALSAGFETVEHPIVVTIDGDLQDDPAEIPRLIEPLTRPAGEAYDVVSGWKRVRRDPLHKRLPSKAFNWLVSRISGVKLNDHNCGLKAYRREVLNEVRLYGELHRFVPVLAAARGFRVTEVAVNHRPREFGQSKYGASRLIKGLLDILTVYFLTDFSHRPQHLLGTAGLVSFLLGGLGMFVLACRWVLTRVVDAWTPVHLHETAALYYSLVFLLIGAQFLSIGLLAEMITAFWGRSQETYSVAEYTAPRRPIPAPQTAPAQPTSE